MPVLYGSELWVPKKNKIMCSEFSVLVSVKTYNVRQIKKYKKKTINTIVSVKYYIDSVTILKYRFSQVIFIFFNSFAYVIKSKNEFYEEIVY